MSAATHTIQAPMYQRVDVVLAIPGKRPAPPAPSAPPPINGEDRGRSGCPAHPRRANSAPQFVVGRDELDALVCLDDLPSTFMNQAVVVVAERKQLAQVCRTTVRPELDVMGLGPVDRPIAAGESAAAVSGFQSSPLRTRDRPRRPPDID